MIVKNCTRHGPLTKQQCKKEESISRTRYRCIRCIEMWNKKRIKIDEKPKNVVTIKNDDVINHQVFWDVSNKLFRGKSKV